MSSLVTILLVYNYRKVKVFKYSSPTFLSITLMGCAVMYTEVVNLIKFISRINQIIVKMVVIYPFLSTLLCVLTKWTRHLGFCITYTALLMKTWR